MAKMEEALDAQCCPECGCFILEDKKQYHAAWHKAVDERLRQAMMWKARYGGADLNEYPMPVTAP